MSVLSLLNIDPDKLFEQYSISEIEDVQKKLQNEIERKREELRTVVGERYRDLIEAADTISQMKTLSEKVIEDVNKMKDATAELQEQQVSGFKVEYLQKDVKNIGWASVASQIKVLIDISEYIWEAVDQSNFTQAALLFLMSRYIKKSLEINPSYKTNKYFPVVSRQWSSILNFKDTILRGAEGTLKSQHSSQVTCSGLISLALLENLTAPQLLDRYISLRSDAVRNILDTHKSLDGTAIKQRLCDSYTLLIYSIIAIYHCFLEHVQAKEGLLWKEMNSHIGPHSSPTLHLLDQVTSDIPSSLFPSAIKEFRPVLDQSLEPLPESQIHEVISTWLIWVRAFVKDQGGLLLQRLSSLRSLQGLRDPPVVMYEEWPLVAQKLLQLPNIDLWNELYRSLITLRAQQLVSVHWDTALKAVQQQIQITFDSTLIESKQSEVDLQWYIWKESTTDLNNLNDFKNTKGLRLKSKGITPRVAELCNALEHKICSLLSDLSTLCPEQEVDPVLLAISHTLKTHQQAVCSNLVLKLVQFVKMLVEGATSEAAVVLLAKFLQSVPELCPSLSKCLSSIDSKSASWQESHSLIQAECLAAYKHWHALASVRILKHITDILGSAVPDLHSIPQWEEITIEEEGETGEKLQSILKVPCCVSLKLQSSLHNLAIMIGHVAIPKLISEQLVDSVLIKIIELYNNDSIGINLTQTQYLQMFLDVKYLVQLFNTNTNTELKSKIQDTISHFESKIDPFDLNVLMPYINDNIRICVHRTQALMGVIGVTGVSAPTTAVVPHRSEEPSVLVLSTSSAMWFPLLHITAPRVSHLPSKPKIKKTTPFAATNTPADLGVKTSSTSSFFGVMATDWFG